MTKKKTELIETSSKTSLQVVKSKEELNDNMKKAIAKIDEELKKLQGPGNGAYKTSCTFKFNEYDSNTAASFMGTSDLQYLLKVLIILKRDNKDYEDNAKELGLTNYPALLRNNLNVSNLIKDVTLRIALVTNHSKIEALKQGKTRLETFLTEEDRLSNTLEDIAKLFV